jgi:hypothetical protein
MTQGHSKIQKRHLVIGLVAVGLVVAYAYRERINEQIGCWAYYDQCTAKRISGLSSKACLARPDAVAYLTTEGVCLVLPE